MGAFVYLGRWRDVPSVPGPLAGAAGGQIGRGDAPGLHRRDRIRGIWWEHGREERRGGGNAPKGKV